METAQKNYNFCLSLLVASASLLCMTSPVQAADQKPNIVHIVADDLGWKDVGFNGCTDICAPARFMSSPSVSPRASPIALRNKSRRHHTISKQKNIAVKICTGFIGRSLLDEL